MRHEYVTLSCDDAEGWLKMKSRRGCHAVKDFEGSQRKVVLGRPVTEDHRLISVLGCLNALSPSWSAASGCAILVPYSFERNIRVRELVSGPPCGGRWCDSDCYMPLLWSSGGSRKGHPPICYKCHIYSQSHAHGRSVNCLNRCIIVRLASDRWYI